MTPFSNRNPIPIALIGIVTLLVGLVAAYRTDQLPVIGDGPLYRAEFAQAAGVRSGNPVKVAGVVVGRVRSVELVGDHVEIGFTVDDAWIGEDSTASVELNTLLGQRYLAIDPQGAEALEPGGEIPLERTEIPYEIIPAVNQLSRTLDLVDTDLLADSLDTLAETFEDTPDDVQGALDGLARLSETISSRDEGLSRLLARAETVTGAIAARDEQVELLVRDVNPLLEELTTRRQAIRRLLVGTQQLGVQLSGLVRDNQDTIGPALADLAEVAEVLDRNRRQIDRGVQALSTYVHLFTTTVGIGRWFDATVCGSAPPNLGGINEKGCEAR